MKIFYTYLNSTLHFIYIMYWRLYNLYAFYLSKNLTFVISRTIHCLVSCSHKIFVFTITIFIFLPIFIDVKSILWYTIWYNTQLRKIEKQYSIRIPIWQLWKWYLQLRFFPHTFIIFFSSLFSMLTTQRLMISLAFPFPFPQKIDEPNRGLVIVSEDGQSRIILQIGKIIPKHDFTKEEK